MKLKKLALIFAVLPLLMKYLPALLLSTTMLLPFGCERSNLFQPQTQEPLNNPIHGPSDEIVFALEVIGAQPNTARALSVATNGFVRYRDARYFLGEVTSALSPEELGKHVALFLEKDFLHLGERYESNTALAQNRYRLLFKHGSVEKSVQTDSVSAPASVQQLLTDCAQQMFEVRKNALQLALSVSRDTLTHGEEVQLTLSVTNPHAHAVQLQRGERFVEFFLIAPQLNAGGEQQDNAPQLWQENLGTGQLQSNVSFSLAPQQQITTSTRWNGRNRNGALVEGTYWLAARLATLPGGVTAMHALHVQKQ